jgi:D-alanyl-D-alanine carboxypeptidase
MRRPASVLLALVLAASAFGMPDAAAAPATGVADDGTRSDVYAFGSARFRGANRRAPSAPTVGMAATPSGKGYWLAGQDGGIFSFGRAGFYGSAGSLDLNQPIVGVAATRRGRGYWLVARDGGVFAFGDARFRGSTGAMRLDQPIVGMAARRSGAGYWLVARDGGVFAFGDARFFGSVPGAGYASTPIVALVGAPDGRGYWMASRVPVPAARFRARATTIDNARAARMQPSSWRPGCPVPLGDLRYLTARYWGFDHKAHTGELVVHADATIPMLHALRALWDARYPIRRMRLIDDYGGSDDASMAADNTSAFNCRLVAGTSRWSEHAYGRAIDINPVENPYVAGSHVSPPAGRAYVDRSQPRPGVIRAGDVVVRTFAQLGWGWGGNFTTAKDYQHFSASGR